MAPSAGLVMTETISWKIMTKQMTSRPEGKYSIQNFKASISCKFSIITQNCKLFSSPPAISNVKAWVSARTAALSKNYHGHALHSGINHCALQPQQNFQYIPKLDSPKNQISVYFYIAICFCACKFWGFKLPAAHQRAATQKRTSLAHTLDKYFQWMCSSLPQTFGIRYYLR